MNFNLHFGELHNDNSINDKNNLFENYILKCYKVKRILISFNCFSEYICMNLHVRFHIVLKIDTSTESVWCIIPWMKHSILLTLRILIYYLHDPACEILDCVKD